MYKFSLLVFCLFASGATYAQCGNSLSIKRATNETQSSKGGVIDVAINGSGQYVCTLMIEKGSGPEKIGEKRGNGNSTVHFEKLNINEIYKIEVEFLAENKTYCKKLVKSLITFEN